MTDIITEKRVLEEDLNRERELLLSIMNTSPAGILVVDDKGKIIYANQTFCENAGYGSDEITGKCIEELSCRIVDISGNPLHLSDFPVMKALARKDQVKFYQFVIERSGGKKVALSANASPIFDKNGKIMGAVCVTLDITEYKKLEAQYLQAQKLEAIGRLTGGIAHDFNNLLSAIIGFSEILLMQLKTDDPIREYIKTIYDAGDKAKSLVQQLLLFSRRQTQTLEVLNLNDIVSNFQKMLSRIIGEDISLKIIKDENIPAIRADRTQIEQVIMNLAVNARDAMPRGGTLIIETKLMDITEDESEGYFDIKPGRYVLLSVTDTGIGMTEEVKSHLFEPFFTTKEVGKGTGLGLATVYGIVKNHGGAIHVYSELGIGTTFKIYFPAAETFSEEIKKEEFKTDALSGTETILVVEDNTDVRNFIETVLKGKGYIVFSHDNPHDAIEFVKTTDKRIDLIITDIIMPGMSGKEMMEKICEFKKDIKYLFMSGYTNDTLIASEIFEGSICFLSKPFKMAEFLKKIRDVLS